MDRDRAADFYEGILENDPTNEQAAAQLESIYREQGSEDAWGKLANLYLDRSQYKVDDPEAFLEARRASARVFEEFLGQPEGSFLVLLTAFTAATYEDEQLLVDLGRLAGMTGLWAELIGQVEDVLREIGDVPPARFERFGAAGPRVRAGGARAARAPVHEDYFARAGSALASRRVN